MIPQRRKMTVTLEIEAIPKTDWNLDCGSIEPTPGYIIIFPDKHTLWVDEKDFARYYLAASPSGVLDK